MGLYCNYCKRVTMYGNVESQICFICGRRWEWMYYPSFATVQQVIDTIYAEVGGVQAIAIDRNPTEIGVVVISLKAPWWRRLTLGIWGWYVRVKMKKLFRVYGIDGITYRYIVWE